LQAGRQEVRLWLSLIAYNLVNLWRRLVKTGGRLIEHARYYWLLLAEGHAAADLGAAGAGRMGDGR
jgi:hypothetical protein